MSKTALKTLFREGKNIKILLGAIIRPGRKQIVSLETRTESGAQIQLVRKGGIGTLSDW